MDSQVLIDQVVRQTMILIAQLATSGGARAPLAHIEHYNAEHRGELAPELVTVYVGQHVRTDADGSD